MLRIFAIVKRNKIKCMDEKNTITERKNKKFNSILFILKRTAKQVVSLHKYPEFYHGWSSNNVLHQNTDGTFQDIAGVIPLHCGIGTDSFFIDARVAGIGWTLL